MAAHDRRRQHGQIPGAEELGVRDIHAFDELSAVALTIASPGRVYRTLDGGYTWTMVFEDRRPEVFFNCMDFADDQRGYAVGDPINGRFLFIETLDGGKNWAPLSAPSRPEPQEAEAQFAASGTCLQANGDNVWIGTGGSVARDRAALTSRGVRESSGDPSQDLASTSSASPPTAPSGLRELPVALPGYSGANRRGVCVCEFSQHGRHGPIRL